MQCTRNPHYRKIHQQRELNNNKNVAKKKLEILENSILIKKTRKTSNLRKWAVENYN